MAASFFYLHLLTSLFLFITTSQSQKTISNITRGSTLYPTTNPSYWLSPSGLYAFGFYPRGNQYSVGIFMVGIPEQTVVWTAARDKPPLSNSSVLHFSTDGSLELQSPQENLTIASGDTASMFDSGNFVLYNAAKNVTWQSFDNPTDTILVNQSLGTGKVMYSRVSEEDTSIGKFQIIMQQDGYVAMYPNPAPYEIPYGYWDSGQGSSGSNVVLTLTSGGRIYTFNDTSPIRNLTNGGPPDLNVIYRATLDPDGIFRLYSYNTTRRGNWSVVTGFPTDKCAPKGLCGLNAYCTPYDLEPTCKCLQGYTLVNASDQMGDCQRNSTAVGCDGIYKNVKYNMIEVSTNFMSLNNSYSVVQTQSKDSCGDECLGDCNCEVALFGDGYCEKQMLPLRYGRASTETNSKSLLLKTTSDVLGGNSQPPKVMKKKIINMAVLVSSVVVMVLGFIVLVVAAVLIHRHRVLTPKSRNIDIMENVTPKLFTFDELRKMTKDFSEEIGKGAFGTVYRGATVGGQVVAVKRLDRVSSNGEKEFTTEVTIIGQTHHRNLVRLVGYCLEGSNRLLVYEYMSNGSLADIIFTPKRQPNWDEKLGFARNIARGILYLHEECGTQIIHCDIKPQNILIDEYGLAKIADFGLSKLLKPDQTNTITNIRGTRGYVAPEWHKNLPVTVKVDVYSFGVVLLEIVCCRKCLDHNLPDEQAVLEDWVYDCFQAGELYRLVDGEDVDGKQLERMVKVALWCVLEEPSLRPSMRKVLLMLEGTIDISVPPRPNSFISAI